MKLSQKDIERLFDIVLFQTEQNANPSHEIPEPFVALLFTIKELLISACAPNKYIPPPLLVAVLSLMISCFNVRAMS